jgi:selenocysteine-specific elongation factor
MLRESPEPLTLPRIQMLCWCRAQEAQAYLQALAEQNVVLRLPSGAWIHQSTLEAAQARIEATLDTFHTSHPQRAGQSESELRSAAGLSHELFSLALARLEKAGVLRRVGIVLSRPQWTPKVTNAEEALLQQIALRFSRAGFAGPASTEVATELRVPVDRVEKCLRLLGEQAVLVHIGGGQWLHQDVLERAKRIVIDLFAKKSRFSTMEFRDTLSVSRKYAVPLLDYLDKIRFTVRQVNERTPGAEAKKLLTPK